jgi:peptidoglycan/xylan/chitin deacetylase (PgdA/CDA1 family)
VPAPTRSHRDRPRGQGPLVGASLLAALVIALVAAGCGSGAAPGASAAPSAGSTSAASPAASSSSSPSTTSGASLQVKTVGPDSVLLHSRTSVTFAFHFTGAAPATWSWRVVGYYGAKMAAGQGTAAAGSSGGSVTWKGTGPGGAEADPGLYLVQVGASGAPHGSMQTIGRVRLQPPVKAKVYFSLPAAGRRVALTFDDGGGATAWFWILRELRDGHAKGTFFPIGQYVGGYAKREAGLTVADSMAIGSHSWSHPYFTKLSDAAIRAQLRQTDDVWWNDFKASTVPYLRPPYGAYNAHVLAIAGQMGYSRIIMWDVDSNDWTNPGVGAIVRNVLTHVRNGSIIVLHTRGKTPKALPLIIAGLRARGYQMVTIPELFKAAGIKQGAR